MWLSKCFCGNETLKVYRVAKRYIALVVSCV